MLKTNYLNYFMHKKIKSIHKKVYVANYYTLYKSYAIFTTMTKVVRINAKNKNKNLVFCRMFILN